MGALHKLKPSKTEGVYPPDSHEYHLNPKVPKTKTIRVSSRNNIIHADFDRFFTHEFDTYEDVEPIRVKPKVQEQPQIRHISNPQEEFLRVHMNAKVRKHFNSINPMSRPREFFTKAALLKQMTIDNEFFKQYLKKHPNSFINCKKITVERLNLAYQNHINRTNYIDNLAEFLYINLQRSKYSREAKLEINAAYWYIHCGFLPTNMECRIKIKPKYIQMLGKHQKSVEHFSQYCLSFLSERDNSPKGGGFILCMLLGAVNIIRIAKKQANEIYEETGKRVDFNSLITVTVPMKDDEFSR